MKKLLIAFLFITISAFSLFACEGGEESEPTEAGLTVSSFAEHCMTDKEIFKQVPAMIVPHTGISPVSDIGGNNFLVQIYGTEKKDYDAYLNLLKDNAFMITASNGDEGLYGSVFNTSLTKNTLNVTVVQLVNRQMTGIIVSEKSNHMSPFQIYDASRSEGIAADAKATLTMLQCNPQFNGGSNAFVVKLKNGHFLVSDGGRNLDANDLIQFLVSETPEGEKPVIDAWVITHAHGDHSGALLQIASDPVQAKRLIVNGVYYNMPSNQVINNCGASGDPQMVMLSAGAFVDENGEKAKVYRPIVGDRYYFCDATLEVVESQDFLSVTQLGTDLNGTTTWTVLTLDGQKILFTGDGEEPAQRMMMEDFKPEDFVFDVITVSHHGFNMTKAFDDFITVDTCLVPHYACVNPIYKDGLSHLLNNCCKEWFNYQKGSIRLTFPYHLGEREIFVTHDYIYDGHEAFREVSRDWHKEAVLPDAE